MPFIERLKEIIEKNYNTPGNRASAGDFDLEDIGWAINDANEDVVIMNDEIGDEDDDDDDDVNDNDYNDCDSAGVSTM